MTGIEVRHNGTVDVLSHNGAITAFQNNSSTTQPNFLVQQDGSGDALVKLTVGGSNDSWIGIDNSNADMLTIKNGGTGLTSGHLTISSTGFSFGGNPDTKALLTLTSTTLGFLPPRMTTAQAITLSGSTPTSGMTIYDTTLNKLRVFTGSAFETVTSA